MIRVGYGTGVLPVPDGQCDFLRREFLAQILLLSGVVRSEHQLEIKRILARIPECGKSATVHIGLNFCANGFVVDVVRLHILIFLSALVLALQVPGDVVGSRKTGSARCASAQKTT